MDEVKGFPSPGCLFQNLQLHDSETGHSRKREHSGPDLSHGQAALGVLISGLYFDALMMVKVVPVGAVARMSDELRLAGAQRWCLARCKVCAARSYERHNDMERSEKERRAWSSQSSCLVD